MRGLYVGFDLLVDLQRIGRGGRRVAPMVGERNCHPGGVDEFLVQITDF